MKSYIFACAAALLVPPASAGDAPYRITLIHGHPIHHEKTREAGIAMGLSITADKKYASSLTEACRELQLATELPGKTADELKLESLFVVPYKEMAVEGLYLPADGSIGKESLVEGKRLERPILDGVIMRAGMPPDVLDATNVEHEISCRLDEPLWTISWQDIRPIGDQKPEAMIERTRSRFMEIYRDVARHAAGVRQTVAEIDHRSDRVPPSDVAGSSAMPR